MSFHDKHAYTYYWCLLEEQEVSIADVTQMIAEAMDFEGEIKVLSMITRTIRVRLKQDI